MRLLDTLIKKRDFHLHQAAKFAELIAVLEGDDEINQMVKRGRGLIVNGAKAHFDALNGAAPEKKKAGRKRVGAKERAAQGRRMKLQWKKKRGLMMAALKKAREAKAAATT